MPSRVLFVPIPKTQLTFVNVPLVPVRTRNGRTRFLCATWGGAMHLFDSMGREKVIPYPPGGQGSYSFVAAVEDGFAWAVHTGGFVTLIDVDRGEVVFTQEVPLKAINWGAAITADGYLVCEGSGSPPQGEVMIYDTNRRQVAHMLAPVSKLGNLYGHFPRAAADGSVVLPMSTPGAELLRIDPQTGGFESYRPRAIDPGFLTDYPIQRSLTFLPDGRLAFPHKKQIDTVTYPDLRDADPLPYPDTRETGWTPIRDYGDGRLFAYHADGGPLYVLDKSCKWKLYLDSFQPKLGNAEPAMFCALPRRQLLGLSVFGEVVRYASDGSARFVAQLNNQGYQRVGHVQPTDGTRAFTTTFINMSFQEVDYRTGKGRNVRPCQVHGGQVAGVSWLDGKLWLATYGGAEITAYDPEAGGEWPVNPRHVLDIGHEQMRPVGMVSDGRDLWTATHAKYGKLGGALVRVDPRAETCKVWRNLVPDHNPTGLRVDAAQRRVYLGTTIHADCMSAPPAKGPAAVIAFDMDRECPAWIAKPRADASSMTVLALVGPDLVMVAPAPGYPKAILLLDARTGEVNRELDPKLPSEWKEETFFVGGDGGLYVACNLGLFRYGLPSNCGRQAVAHHASAVPRPQDGSKALDAGPGEKVLDGWVSEPVVRGKDLLFIRDRDLGVAEGIFA